MPAGIVAGRRPGQINGLAWRFHQLHIFDDPAASAPVVAGVLSVVMFPPSALTLLRRSEERIAPLAGDGEQLIEGALHPVGKHVHVVNHFAVSTKTEEQRPSN